MSNDLFKSMKEEEKNLHFLRQFQQLELKDKIDHLGLLLFINNKMNVKLWDVIVLLLLTNTILLGIIAYKSW
jgi:hypothetical protein